MNRPDSVTWRATSRTAVTICLWLALLLIPVNFTQAAFEGRQLFRPLIPAVDGLYSPALNNPALLPTAAYWATAGQVQPYGLDWAVANQLAAGGHWRGNRGALGIWSSGDEQYGETTLTLVMSRALSPGLTAGVSLQSNRVQVAGYSGLESELVWSAALAGALTPQLYFSIWYAGLGVGVTDYSDLDRQLFQLVLGTNPGRAIQGRLALEETPGFPISQVVEARIQVAPRIQVRLGYRTAPALPSVTGTCSIGMLRISAGVSEHPILGISTVFGIAVQ